MTYRDWRKIADAYLERTIPGVECYAEDHVLAALRHSMRGGEIWAMARDNQFFEGYHQRQMSQ